MEQNFLRKLLSDVYHNKMGIEEALSRLKNFPLENLDFATIDHHRAIRRGFPEVIFGEGKTDDQIIKIIEKLSNVNNLIMVTRISEAKARAILQKFPKARHNSIARTITIERGEVQNKGEGTVLVVCAGTSDLPVAEEAKETARIMGNHTDTLYDVGISGIHRIFLNSDKLRSASVIIVAAGMEGALPSVVGGLVAKPVIAVPTSVGYGSSFKGITALLGMLNSCTEGIVVVNIDNGFGAGYAASLINQL